MYTVDEGDPDPQGGVFDRDPATGRLTGLLLENAQQRVRDAAAEDEETVYRGLLAAFEELAANGVTTVSDAGGFWTQDHPAAWERARDEGELTVRGVNTLYLYPDRDLDEQLEELAARFRDDPGDRVRFDTAKIYLDGILDLGTAALIEPYETPIDAERPSGFSYFDEPDLATYVAELHDLGFQLDFHVIGDAAVRQALDAIAAIRDVFAVAVEEIEETTVLLTVVGGREVHRDPGLG